MPQHLHIYVLYKSSTCNLKASVHSASRFFNSHKWSCATKWVLTKNLIFLVDWATIVNKMVNVQRNLSCFGYLLLVLLLAGFATSMPAHLHRTSARVPRSTYDSTTPLHNAKNGAEVLQKYTVSSHHANLIHIITKFWQFDNDLIFSHCTLYIENSDSQGKPYC